MPVVTRARAKQLNPFLNIPQEILGEICRYVLSEPEDHDVHIRNYCCIGLIFADTTTQQLDRDLSQLQRPFQCPGILLVNKHVYQSAKPFVQPQSSFTICDLYCMWNFIGHVPIDLIQGPLTFYCRVPSFAFLDKDIRATMRQQLTDAYGEDVEVNFRHWNKEFHQRSG